MAAQRQSRLTSTPRRQRRTPTKSPRGSPRSVCSAPAPAMTRTSLRLTARIRSDRRNPSGGQPLRNWSRPASRTACSCITHGEYPPACRESAADASPRTSPSHDHTPDSAPAAAYPPDRAWRQTRQATPRREYDQQRLPRSAQRPRTLPHVARATHVRTATCSPPPAPTATPSTTLRRRHQLRRDQLTPRPSTESP